LGFHEHINSDFVNTEHGGNKAEENNCFHFIWYYIFKPKDIFNEIKYIMRLSWLRTYGYGIFLWYFPIQLGLDYYRDKSNPKLSYDTNYEVRKKHCN
jgi:hypothetical protein